MIHPHTELRHVSPQIGYGVFATAPIPKGTIVYVKDHLEIEISRYKFKKLDKRHKEIVEKYSYIDEKGVRIVSWDHAKYVNHRCDCNTMSTGYGFEVALRDIARDEEITDEYGLFNLTVPIEVQCGCPNCRHTLLPTDIDHYSTLWDQHVHSALMEILKVEQPLWQMMDVQTRMDLMRFLSGKAPYKPVSSLKYVPTPSGSKQFKRTTKISRPRAA